MLKAGEVYESPRGTRIVVRENSPERISIERTLPPRAGGGDGSKHRHMQTNESFELLSGAAMTSIDGRDRVLEVGTPLDIPIGSTHVNPHNSADTTATIVQSVAPRSRAVEVYFTSWLEWFAAGKTLPSDEPTTLQLAAIIKEGGFGGTFLVGLPVVVQKLGLPVLGLVAGLTGTRAAKVPK